MHFATEEEAKHVRRPERLPVAALPQSLQILLFFRGLKKNDGAMANNVFFVFYCLIFELLLIGSHSRHTEKGGGGRRGIVNHI